MAISKIVQNSLDTDSISLGPKIRSVQVANSTYVVKDDTAVNTGGGYIVITGSGFTSNSTVLIGANTACSVSYVSATQLRAQVPSNTPGSYTVYVVTGDGGTAIRVNALTYSDSPTWVTTSPLTEQFVDSTISIQLSASGANTYALQTGSTLPSGVSLAANGLITGTVTGITVDTTYNFTVDAIDSELQESPKALAVTISVGDTYFSQTTFLLENTGTNNVGNDTFVDSSSYTGSVTRSGNVAQGSFGPYQPFGWSQYFDGSSSLDVASSAGFQWGTSDFTMECWVIWGTTPGSGGDHLAGTNASGGGLFWASDTSFQWNAYAVGATANYTNPPWQTLIGKWNHIAYSRQSNTGRLYINGALVASAADNNNYTVATPFIIGSNPNTSQFSNRVTISNLRVIKGQALYTNTSGAFVPSTAALTNSTVGSTGTGVAASITGTCSLLTCQSSRFLDNSGNNLAISRRYNYPRVRSGSPFKGAAVWSHAAYGSSAYWDGSDYLELPADAKWRFGSGDFTIESWMYIDNASNDFSNLAWHSNGSQSFILIGSTPVRHNTWNHCAITRTGTTYRFWINGVQDSGGAQTGRSNIENNADVLRIGYGVDHSAGSGRDIVHCGEQGGSGNKWFWYLANGGTGSYTGYHAGFRISNNVRYTTTFTPPTLPMSSDGNTSLLLNFAPNIFDARAQSNLETRNGAVTTTSATKFSTATQFFDGSNDFLIDPHYSNTFDFGTGDFTVEAWIRFGTVGNGQIISAGDGGNTGAMYWQYYSSQLQFGAQTVGSIAVNNWSPTAGQWYHVAVTRSGTATKQFVDGTQLGSTATNSQNFVDGPIYIGNGGAGYFNGRIEDLRVTKGFARYTTNFSVPTGSLPLK